MSLVINFLTGAPRVPAPATPDPPAKGNGHFGNLLSDLWEREDQASGFLGEASSAMGDAQRGVGNAVADIFNQHGLLAKDASVVASAATSATPVSAPIGGIVLASDGDVAATDPQPTSTAASAGPIASNVLPRAEAPPPTPSIAVSEVSALESSRTAVIEPVAMEMAPFAASRRAAPPVFTAKPSALTVARGFLRVDANAESLEDVQSERTQPSRRDVAAGGAISDAQLALHIGEQGATVVGRSFHGEQSGRARLRDRIAALLSRYGLRTHDIRLNGAPLLNATNSRREEL
jgi:hypothetical protein